MVGLPCVSLPRRFLMPTPSAFVRPGLVFWSVTSFVLLLAWDASGLDLPMARWFGSPAGFAFRDHWFWSGVLHKDMHRLAWAFELALLTATFLPFGSLRKLPVSRRAQLAVTTLAALLVVIVVKSSSRTSCPWSLSEFGGTAAYVSHWAWGALDGGEGRCFPAGHASAGFAFVGGFFGFRQVLPHTARRWLAGALLIGLVLGLAQQVRGAHYMSHTLWTAWLCWITAALLDAGFTGAINAGKVK